MLDRAVLLKWKSSLDQQISETESELKPLQARHSKLVVDRNHVEALLASSCGNGEPPKPAPSAASPPMPPGTAKKELFTPVEQYWVPILATLVEFGGSARSEQIIDRVGKKMDAVLTAADRERLPSGIDVRWRNRVHWQRENMKRQGLLRNDSPRGVWEITEAGRRWLEVNR